MIDLLTRPDAQLEEGSFHHTFAAWRQPTIFHSQLDFWRRGFAPLARIESRWSEGQRAGALAVGENGRGCRIHVDTGAEPGPVIGVAPDIEGLEIRKTSDGRDPALVEAASSVSLEYGDKTWVLDRTRSLPDVLALMGPGAWVAVAHYQGKDVGVAGTSIRPVRLSQRDTCLEYTWLLRVDRSARGIGINEALRASHFSQMPHVEAVIGHIHSENRALDRKIPNRWPTAVHRALLDCRKLASGCPAIRETTTRDLAEVAKVLNDRKSAEFLYRPYSTSDLQERLSRAPSYTVEDLLNLGGATIGVWRARDVWRDPSGREPARVIAHVADAAVAPGAEEDVEPLLRACCERLADDGFTHLAWYGSAETRGINRVRALADSVESHEIFTGAGVPPPPEGAAVHVDPIYF
jgi:hypothetical protein